MNIAIFTNNYLPNPYGVSTSIETFRRDFEKLGPSSSADKHTVYIFAPNWPGYVDKNPRVFRYPSVDINLKFRFPLAVPYSWKIGKILKKLDIDIIHSQHPNLLGTAAVRWAQKLARRRGGKKIPLVFTWHTLYDHYAHFAKIIPPKIAAWYMVKKAVKYANRADAVVVPTDSIIPILRRWGVKNKNIFPVATGVVEEEFKNASQDIIRKKYAISKEEIVLILASRLTEEKNVLFVYDSIKEILKNNSNSKFLVVGGGNLEREIRNLSEKDGISEKVILSGEVPHGEVKNYFAASDIFVCGSKSETQGMFTSEAMYMGLPIVAVRATGTSSLVINNGNGFLVGEDEKDFEEAVAKLIENKELRQKFGEVSARIAKTQFTSEISAKKMLEVYQKAMEKYQKT